MRGRGCGAGVGALTGGAGASARTWAMLSDVGAGPRHTWRLDGVLRPSDDGPTWGLPYLAQSRAAPQLSSGPPGCPRTRRRRRCDACAAALLLLTAACAVDAFMRCTWRWAAASQLRRCTRATAIQEAGKGLPGASGASASRGYGAGMHLCFFHGHLACNWCAATRPSGTSNRCKGKRAALASAARQKGPRQAKPV